MKSRGKYGFTLIEMLVVITILGMLTATATGMFFTLLRGSLKSRTMLEVKQNGEYALGTIERMIRNAKEIVDFDSDNWSYLTIKNQDNGLTTFRCCGGGEEDSNYLIASESGILTCENARLTNNKVKVSNCRNVFKVTAGETGVSPAIVSIEFNLGLAESGIRPEEAIEMKFKTQIELRNY